MGRATGARGGYHRARHKRRTRANLAIRARHERRELVSSRAFENDVLLDEEHLFVSRHAPEIVRDQTFEGVARGPDFQHGRQDLVAEVRCFLATIVLALPCAIIFSSPSTFFSTVLTRPAMRSSIVVSVAMLRALSALHDLATCVW